MIGKIISQETRDITIFNYRERIKNVLKRSKPYIVEHKEYVDRIGDAFYIYLFDIYEEAYRDKALWDKSFASLVNEIYTPTFIKIDGGSENDKAVEINSTERSGT